MKNLPLFVAIALLVGLVLPMVVPLPRLSGWVFDGLVAALPSDDTLESVLVVPLPGDSPRGEYSDFAAKLRDLGARLVVLDSDSESLPSPQTLSSEAHILRGPFTVPAPRDGMFRGPGPAQSRNTSLAWTVATHLGIDLPAEDYLLSFRVPRKGIPVIAFEQLQNDQLPGSLVDGKVHHFELDDF